MLDELATMHRGPGDERRVVLRHRRLFELAPTRSTDDRPRTIVKKAKPKGQRRGRTTKPFVSWLCLTISMLSAGTLPTAASACPGVVAATGRDRLKLTEAPAYFVEDQPGSTYQFEVA